MPALAQLEQAWDFSKSDPLFQRELKSLLHDYAGRPTPLTFASRLSEELGDVRVYLKREDLAHTGAHKINNALGQILLASRMGKKRIIAETGAGQHGVATATACAKFGMDCVVYMGAEDVRRQSLNVLRMRLLGAEVRPVVSGSQTLKDAINETIRDWVTNVRDTHYVIGSVIGPHPYPSLVRDLQTVIGREARSQILDLLGRLPDIAIACVGGGSNAIGLFYPFLDDPIRLIGVEAAGEGLDGRHAATITKGRPGILHGTHTYLLQDDDGQILDAHSISAGLDYPGVGPEHAWLSDSKRAEYVSVDDSQALAGFRLMCETEGIVPALEPSHAIAYLPRLVQEISPGGVILLGLSGRGDKDIDIVGTALSNVKSDF